MAYLSNNRTTVIYVFPTRYRRSLQCFGQTDRSNQANKLGYRNIFTVPFLRKSEPKSEPTQPWELLAAKKETPQKRGTDKAAICAAKMSHGGYIVF